MDYNLIDYFGVFGSELMQIKLGLGIKTYNL